MEKLQTTLKDVENTFYTEAESKCMHELIAKTKLANDLIMGTNDNFDIKQKLSNAINVLDSLKLRDENKDRHDMFYNTKDEIIELIKSAKFYK